MALQYRFRPLAGQWPRPSQTPSHKRKSKFTFKSTFPQTLDKLENELRKLGMRDAPVIQADFAERYIRNDGMIRADAPVPSFPGIVLAFESKHGPLKFACDDLKRWEDNLHAIALTLERLRLADLYGVTSKGEQYAGWKALPPASVTTPTAFSTLEDAVRFLLTAAGMDTGAGMVACHINNPKDAESTYRTAVRRLHPDTNGGAQSPMWQGVQNAWDVIEKHHQRAR